MRVRESWEKRASGVVGCPWGWHAGLLVATSAIDDRSAPQEQREIVWKRETVSKREI